MTTFRCEGLPVLIFRNFSVQVSPRACLFFENPESGSRFPRNLELQKDAKVFCWVKAVEDGIDPLASYNMALSGEHCGAAVIHDPGSTCDIYLYLPAQRLEFFLSAWRTVNGVDRSVRFTLAVEPDHKLVKERRIHLVQVDPSININTDDEQ